MRAALGLTAVGWGANQFAAMLPVYQEVDGATSAEVTLLFGAYAAGLIPTLLAVAPLSDRWGRRRVMLPVLALSLVATIVLMVGGHHLWLLLVGRVLAGVASGAAFAPGTAWVKELSSGPAGTGARRAAVALIMWERNVLQPEARHKYGSRVTSVQTFGTYSCRNIYHRTNSPRSQHATAAGHRQRRNGTTTGARPVIVDGEGIRRRPSRSTSVIARASTASTIDIEIERTGSSLAAKIVRVSVSYPTNWTAPKSLTVYSVTRSAPDAMAALVSPAMSVRERPYSAPPALTWSSPATPLRPSMSTEM